MSFKVLKLLPARGRCLLPLLVLLGACEDNMPTLPMEGESAINAVAFNMGTLVPAENSSLRFGQQTAVFADAYHQLRPTAPSGLRAYWLVYLERWDSQQGRYVRVCDFLLRREQAVGVGSGTLSLNAAVQVPLRSGCAAGAQYLTVDREFYNGGQYFMGEEYSYPLR